MWTVFGKPFEFAHKEGLRFGLNDGDSAMKLSLPIYQLKRRAKSMAREERIPLHKALDRVASMEGFAAWSLLSARAARSFSDALLGRLQDGDLVLLAARPGQGKTIVGLHTLVDARRADRPAILFTLDMTEEEARHRLVEMSDPRVANSIGIETSDDIGADFIVSVLAGAKPGTVAVVDYLQLLDQRRSKPPLTDQIEKLRQFAVENGLVLVFLSQVDRSFNQTQRKVPDIADVRLPNPVPIEVFNKRLFLHDGEVRLENCAA